MIKNDTERDALILFIRYPERGMVLKRLAASIGEELAFELSIRFIRDLLITTQSVAADTIIVGTGLTGKGPAGLFGETLRLLQHGKDTGSRIHHAFSDLFSRGYGRAVLLGDNTPGLPAEYIRRAFHELEGHDAVLGPASDGGCYLAAFRKEALRPDLFQDLPWGTGGLFYAALEAIERASLELFIMPQWERIGDIGDLARFDGNPELSRWAPQTREFIEAKRDQIFPAVG